jgi:hypothetical protein
MKAVEEQLRELVELPFDDVVARCAITTRTHPDYVRPECLVHMLRRTRDDNSDARFNRLFPLLLKRIAMALPRAERKEGKKVLVDAVVSAINEAAMDRVKVLLTLDRSGGDRLDFYEVHFDEAVAKLRAKARGTIGRRAARETPIELDPETNELPPSIERAAARLKEPDDAFLFDPVFRSRLLAAIDDLPEEQKEVVTMTMANIQSESKDPAIPSISAILQCDPRTVHNRRVRAVLALRDALGLGEDM